MNFNGEDMVLNMQRSLYEKYEEPRRWYEKLKSGIETRGFTKSGVDQCQFISKKVICAAYVGDCLLFAIDQTEIDTVLA